MSDSHGPHLVVAISSRALFDLDDSHRVFEEQGIQAYADYQLAHEEEPLAPGVAFHLVEKLTKLQLPSAKTPLVEVVLLSRNSANTGLRIFNSIAHHGLPITRAAFTQGESPYPYALAFGAHLFLSANPDDVAMALNAGLAAASIFTDNVVKTASDRLRIAFDGDAVIFSDESEQIYQAKGLEAFTENETKSRHIPLSGGPFKSFLAALHACQQQFSADVCPIRTALVTARSAPAHERVIRTLREWDIRLDEAVFLGGMPKGEFLRAFQADFFFDDQRAHCDSARDHHVASGHVLSGVKNK